MKITYYIRDPREGNYSLEKIFNTIGEILSKDHTVTYFFVNSTRSKLWNIREARRFQGDINHITGDVNWLAYGLNPKKTILTAHDIGHYIYTLKGIKKTLYRILWWKIPLKLVAFITAISSFTKVQLVEYFKVGPNTITVINNPLTTEFSKSGSTFNSSKPAILQVGSMPNKNIDRLIEAVKDIPCKLLLLRKKNTEMSNKLKKLDVDHEFYTNLSKQDVLNLYISSDILFFASTYEGFGLPIIEAQAIGRTVVTSNLQPMLEVAGSGACFVNPFDVDEIKLGLLRIIKDKEYREHLIDMGQKNILRFEACKIAAQYLEIYKIIVNA